MLKKFNWLALVGRLIAESSAGKAREILLFSKTDTDKIGRHV